MGNNIRKIVEKMQMERNIKKEKIKSIENNSESFDEILNSIIDIHINDEPNVYKVFNTKQHDWDEKTYEVCNSIFDWLDRYFLNIGYDYGVLYMQRYGNLYRLEAMFGQGSSYSIDKIESINDIDWYIKKQKEYISDLEDEIKKIQRSKNMANETLKDLLYTKKSFKEMK